MLNKIISCALLVAFSLSVNVALAGMDYPEEMMDVSSPYPGATITQTTKAHGTVMVGMESSDNLDSIFEFYKNTLATNGWTLSSEMQSPELSAFMGVKGSNTVRVNIAKDPSGKSIIMLMLSPNP